MAWAINRRLLRDNPVGIVVAVNVAVYMIEVVMDAFTSPGFSGGFLSMPSRPDRLLRCPWTVLTYMVAQYDFMHLLVNMLWLWGFGRFLQDVVSSRRFAVIYLAGGLGGAAVFMAACSFLPSLSGVGHRLVGSSASVIAIVAVTAIRLPAVRVGFFMMGTVRLSLIAWVTIALDMTGLLGSHPGAHFAHLGGLIAGVACALWMPRRAWRPESLPAGGAVSIADDRRQLDELLDKIQRSGFASLSMDERRRLMRLSDRERRRN